MFGGTFLDHETTGEKADTVASYMYAYTKHNVRTLSGVSKKKKDAVSHNKNVKKNKL